MATVQFAPHFLRQAKQLPMPIKSVLKEQIRRLQENPGDVRLHVKALHGKLSGLFSFRITRNYRVIYKIDAGTIYILLAVDDRKDVYR